MEDEVVHLRPTFNLRKLAEVENDGAECFVATNLGMLLRIRSSDGAFEVLDADGKVFRQGQLQPWDVRGRAVTQFLADKMLVAVMDKQNVRVWRIDSEPQKVFRESLSEEDWDDSWRSPGCALSPDGVFLYRVEAVDQYKCKLRCWNMAEKKVVAVISLQGTLGGFWFVEVSPPPRSETGWIVRCHLYAGQDGAEHQKLHHCGDKLLEMEDDMQWSATDVVQGEDGGYFECERDDGPAKDCVEIGEDDLRFAYSALYCSWKRDKAIVVCDSGLVFTMDMADVALVKDLIFFDGKRCPDTVQFIFRGFHTRLWTMAPLTLWEAAPVFDSYEEWIDWSPDTNYLFSASFHAAVRTFLMCAKHLLGNRVPKDIRRLLTSYIARAWLHGQNNCDATVAAKKKRRAK